jgi:hypothetical protein
VQFLVMIGTLVKFLSNLWWVVLKFEKKELGIKSF